VIDFSPPRPGSSVDTPRPPFSYFLGFYSSSLGKFRLRKRLVAVKRAFADSEQIERIQGFAKGQSVGDDKKKKKKKQKTTVFGIFTT